jgi:cellulose synthase/poly-beta-1,6-N-acetylglucosamine synthase-like glycosyltransferase
MIALLALVVSASLIAWVYVGYPIALALLARVRPRPRLRAPLLVPITVIVPAYNEEAIIEAKIANVRSGSYPQELVELIVASDGSADQTVDLARRAGDVLVLDLPRGGKVAALTAAVARATGEILVFTDADCLFEPETLSELVANFSDPVVGGATGNEVRRVYREHGISRGEVLYWRYEQWLKRLEDSVGSTVSACGSLYALRRSLFRPPGVVAGNDDVLISTEVVRAGQRLAFDAKATVLVGSARTGGDEFKRKVRVINGGLRTWLSLSDMLNPWNSGLYAIQALSRKLLRRLLPFCFLTLLISSAWLAAADGWWWVVLGPQLLVCVLSLLGWALRGRELGHQRILSIPYYFALANLAAAVAVLSLFTGTRFESWTPSGRDELGVRAPAG